MNWQQFTLTDTSFITFATNGLILFSFKCPFDELTHLFRTYLYSCHYKNCHVAVLSIRSSMCNCAIGVKSIWIHVRPVKCMPSLFAPLTMLSCFVACISNEKVNQDELYWNLRESKCVRIEMYVNHTKMYADPAKCT